MKWMMKNDEHIETYQGEVMKHDEPGWTRLKHHNNIIEPRNLKWNPRAERIGNSIFEVLYIADPH